MEATLEETKIIFLNDDENIDMQILSIDRSNNDRVNGRDKILIKTLFTFFGTTQEITLLFVIVPSTSRKLLLTTTVGNEYEINHYITDPDYSFTEHCGGISFMDNSDIIKMFKTMLQQ
jgi:hypothetical protein